MLKQKEKLIFVLFLFSCIFLSMSFVSAENNITFDDLKNEIDNAQDTLVLNKNYDLDNSTSGISINKPISFEGNNFCINANNSNRIFNILSNNVTLKDIVFICGESDDFNIITTDSQKNGIFYWPANNGEIINCTFVYNKYPLNSGTFDDLAYEISNAEGIFVLNRDYVFTKGHECKHIDWCSVNNGVLTEGITLNPVIIGHDEEGIIINKTIIIDGKGHVLDGKGMSRIFKVINGSVIFKNIIFRDGSSDKGSAICGESLVFNSTFENNYCRNNIRYNDDLSASIYGLIPSPFYYLTCYGGAIYNVNATNCIFKSNHADWGGAVYGGSAVDCIFKFNHANQGGAMCGGSAVDCIFKFNHANRGGAVYDGNAVNCTFADNSAYEYGGAVCTAFVFNCIFINNSAKYGGASYKGACDLCIFINNTASVNGGAICSHRHHDNIFSGDKISNSIFINNSAGCDGGAVWGLRDHALNSTINNCTFKNNHAMENGGAVYVAIIFNSTFINNTALNGGDVYGSVLSLISSLNASDSTFVSSNNNKTFSDLDNMINHNNQSEIYLYDDYSFDLSHDFKYFDEGICISRSIIIHGNNHILNANNFARFFMVYGGNVVFENICFKNGKTSGDGGAINGLCTVLNSTFTNNYAYGVGGALYGVNCFNSSFIENSAIHGGAVSCSNVSNSIFSNNSAHDAGAALESIVYNSYFIFNHCDDSGGAMLRGESVNCVFINNSAGNGGAICDCLAINSTFILNSAAFGGAMQRGSALNCIFINNSVFYNFAGVTNGYGGAIFKGSAFNCSFINNSAFDAGGAIFKGSAFNCSFINNHANNGGAIYIGFDTNYIFGQGMIYIPINATIDNCYFENNTSNENGGAVCTFENNSLINRSVFINNNAKLGKDIYSNLCSIQIINSKYVSLYVNQSKITKNNISEGHKDKIKKVSPKIIAKNKTFNKGTKIKKYTVTLKNNGKTIKDSWITLKINGKPFKAKTNNKGQATFKIIKLTKKGKYNAMITYKGNMYYNKVIKKIKIIVK